MKSRTLRAKTKVSQKAIPLSRVSASTVYLAREPIRMPAATADSTPEAPTCSAGEV